MESVKMEKEEKDVLFQQRKEMKQAAHAVVRSHYLVLVFLTLILILFGAEINISTMGWGSKSASAPVEEGQEAAPGSVLSSDRIYTHHDVLNDIFAGRLKEGEEKTNLILQRMQEKADVGTSMFGGTQGVLATLLNTVMSGKIFAKLGQTIRVIVRSDFGVGVVFIIGAFLFYTLIFTFFRNFYSAAIRRVYLEARIYPQISFLDITHILAVRKWVRASWVMLVKIVYLFLWSLTIAGAAIKYFSYFAVPYIVAENPSVSAKEAITLSRKMMDGHKMELFKYRLTMLGWILLGAVTFGISDLVYGMTYRIACLTEFYVRIREEAIAREIPGTELLDDRYLFEKADRILLYETYFDVIDEITVIHENKVELTGYRKVVADWFGLWLDRTDKKKKYDDQQGREYQVSRFRASMDQKAYPSWLNPLWENTGIEKLGHFFFLRNYTVWTLFLMFMAFSMVGWSWEVALHFLQTGMYANRGTLHGPWLPIYGSGGIIVLMLCSKFRKKPVLEFITAVTLCGILEYFSAYMLEMKYHQRWWSYDGYFLNLHGRICAEGLLVFGVGCCAVVYLLAPIFDFLISRLNTKVLIGICAILAIVYVSDFVYSRAHPNMAKGAVEAVAEPETPAADKEASGGAEAAAQAAGAESAGGAEAAAQAAGAESAGGAETTAQAAGAENAGGAEAEGGESARGIDTAPQAGDGETAGDAEAASQAGGGEDTGSAVPEPEAPKEHAKMPAQGVAA